MCRYSNCIDKDHVFINSRLNERSQTNKTLSMKLPSSDEILLFTSADVMI
jgi:hypothetical protein